MTMVDRYLRSSVRSKNSSSSTTRSDNDLTSNGNNRGERIKDCCRKLVAFMCTQVGVGGLVVGYTVVGAFTFQYLETRAERPELASVKLARRTVALDLFAIACRDNVFNRTVFAADVDELLVKYQSDMVLWIKAGYDGRTVQDVWSIPAALMFSLSIITMIGYGNMVPRTAWGKGVTVLYAVVGIPLYVLYFMNMGEVLAGTFRWLYTWLHNCTHHQQDGHSTEQQQQRVIVSSSASLWVISGYIATGAVLFAEWEKWSYLDSTYFCVTSLCKIGLGDFVPGANLTDFKAGNQTKLVVNFVYMLVGLGLVAMCYNLMRDEVRVKVREWREDLGQCLEDVRARVVQFCCRRGGGRVDDKQMRLAY